MHRAPHRALLPLVVVALLAGSAPAQAEALLDLSGPIPGGEFRAWRIRLDAPGTIEAGATSSGVESGQPVVPLLSVAMKDGAPWSASALFLYDAEASATAVVRAAGQEQRIGSYTIVGGGWTTYNAPAGEYLIVLALGPAQGAFDGILRVQGPAAILASEAGPAFFGRGVDSSDTSADVFGKGNAGYARAWGYDGADLAFPVEGRMFGFVGYHQGGARWEAPDGTQFPSFVVDGAPGDWTASFPAEAYPGPVCPGFCLPGWDTREDPPFAIGADVGI